MALLDGVFKGGNVLTGAAIGLGGLVLAPTLLPLLRGTAKLVIKTGMLAYEEGRSAVAGLGDQIGGVVREAREEFEHDRARRPRAVGNTASSHEGPSGGQRRSRGRTAASLNSEPTVTATPSENA